MVLEGGYSLEALEVSSEAVVKVLKTSPKDTEAFDEIVTSYGYELDEAEGLGAYEVLKKQALEYPRYSFRVTMSSIAKLIKKTWGSIVEDLIFEKPRRKSSAQSKKSSGSKGDIDHIKASVAPSTIALRNRLNSMDDSEDSPPKNNQSLTPLLHPDKSLDGGRSKNDLKKSKSIIQVDDPIDEQAEIERDIKK